MGGGAAVELQPHAPTSRAAPPEGLGGPAVAAGASYWDAARVLVPELVCQALDDLPRRLNASVGPDDVKPLRIAILRAREGLDVFSFAYPFNLTGPERRFDLWDLLRRDLDRGYEVLGEFQDLAHSGVDYDAKDAKARLGACLAWVRDMQADRARYDLDAYVARPLDHQLCKHRHVSKFFWGYDETWPLPELSGQQNIVRLVRRSQLAQVLDNYTAVVHLEHVYLEPDHTRFHLFRKLIRSVLAVLDFFPEILPPALGPGAAPTSAPLPDLTSCGGDVPGGGGGGGRRALLELRLTRPRGRKGDVQGPGGGAAAACDVGVAVGDLRSLFKNLGQVNNKVFAYEFYTAKGRAHRAARARRECDCAWRALAAWMDEVDLPGAVRCLASALVEQSVLGAGRAAAAASRL